jgi:hypothetical protein
MFVMHRLVQVVENQLAKNCRRKFNFRGKIQHAKNQKNCKLEGGGNSLFVCTNRLRRPRVASKASNLQSPVARPHRRLMVARYWATNGHYFSYTGPLLL